MLTTIRTIILILLFIPSSWLLISKKNKAIKAAAESYATANYEKSVADHLLLTSDFDINDPGLTYNLGLSYQYNGQKEEAQRTFMSLITSSNKQLASFAYNHNGILLAQDQAYEEALNAFKYALINDSKNEAARYNYELLARWMEENPDQQDQNQEGEDDENKDDQQDQDQEQQEQDKNDENKKDGEGEEETDDDEASKSEQKEDKDGQKSQEESENKESELESDLSDREKAMEQLKERLKEMNLTPEQAAQILDAMNAAELRFIQQNRKKPTKRPDRGLPDW